jgi:hypothetical protein
VDEDVVILRSKATKDRSPTDTEVISTISDALRRSDLDVAGPDQNRDARVGEIRIETGRPKRAVIRSALSRFRHLPNLSLDSGPDQRRRDTGRAETLGPFSHLERRRDIRVASSEGWIWHLERRRDLNRSRITPFRDGPPYLRVP